MAQRVANRQTHSNCASSGVPLCVKDKIKAQAAAATAASVATGTKAPREPVLPSNGGTVSPATAGNGRINGTKGRNNTSGNNGAGHPPLAPCAMGRPSLVIERSEIIRLALQYTSCAGCSAAVKGLLERPISELRLVNAVMEEAGDMVEGCHSGNESGRTGGGASCGQTSCSRNGSTCNPHRMVQHGNVEQTAGGGAGGGGVRSALCVRQTYLEDRERLEKLLEMFPLESITKKVQPKGVALRCETHRRNPGQSGAEGWEWEDAWDRLPADLRQRVAAIDVDVLEAAMHQATSTHRFCADCKHNVVTAFDLLTCKCDLADIDNEDEFLPDLFWPLGGVGPMPGDPTGQKAVLSCPLEEVEDLICWHEDFDSREYSRSSQRHAATLEHGQREVRSIVGSVLLTQLRTNYHNHLAQVQGEQYLFALVLHAIRTRIEGSGLARAVPGGPRGHGGHGGRGGGHGSCSELNDLIAFDSWVPGIGPACPGCGRGTDSSCPLCGGTGVSLSELGLLVNDDEKKSSSKTKSKKKRERKARAKAAKKEQDGAGAGQAAGGGPGLARGRRRGGECSSGRDSSSQGSSGSGGGAARNQRGKQGQGQRDGSGVGDMGGSGERRYVAGDNMDMPSREHSGPGKRRGSTGAAAGGVGMVGKGLGIGSSAGSLLSMLGGGAEGDTGGFGDDEGIDEGIDEDLVREMERLRRLKARADVQRSRAALRSNLRKNFDQLLSRPTSS